MEHYDGVINKPTLDEALEHYGVKGMKWRKRKNALKNLGVKIDRKLRGIKPEEVSDNMIYEVIYPGSLRDNKPSKFRPLKKTKRYKTGRVDYGKANSHSGKKGSKFTNESIEAGRKRVAKKKK